MHDPALLAFLASAWEDWEAAGLPEDPGQDRVVPYIFPHPGLVGPLEPLVPAATWARPGAFCFDTMTLIGPGTWQAARGAADVALTAADLVSGGRRAVYACCRPPGHHVTRSAYGGSCYLNNAAIAAERLRELGAARVGIVDIDAHHGNGAQSIFWERNDVFTGSVHVDPETGWFPHYLGTAASSERVRGLVRTATCRCRRAPVTPTGCAASRRSCRQRGATAPRHSFSRSGSMLRAAIPRARSR